MSAAAPMALPEVPALSQAPGSSLQYNPLFNFQMKTGDPSIDNPQVDLSAPPPVPVAQSQNFVMPRNPQLPMATMAPGMTSDSRYEAQLAALRHDLTQKYNNVLQQLGYIGDNGQFVPGTVEIAANRSRKDLAYNLDLAREQATQERQREGSLFSGRRGVMQARAEHPFVTALADLNVDVPRQLAQLYEQAGDIGQQFTIGQNNLLADLADRLAAAAGSKGGASTPPPPSGPTPIGSPGVTIDPTSGLAAPISPWSGAPAPSNQFGEGNPANLNTLPYTPAQVDPAIAFGINRTQNLWG